MSIFLLDSSVKFILAQNSVYPLLPHEKLGIPICKNKEQAKNWEIAIRKVNKTFRFSYWIYHQFSLCTPDAQNYVYYAHMYAKIWVEYDNVSTVYSKLKFARKIGTFFKLVTKPTDASIQKIQLWILLYQSKIFIVTLLLFRLSLLNKILILYF